MKTLPFSIAFLFAIVFCLFQNWSVAFSQDSPAAKQWTGTAALEMQGDIASELVTGVDRFLLKELDRSVQKRIDFWPKPDRETNVAFGVAAYESATQSLREELRIRLGMVDPLVPSGTLVIQSPVSAKEKGSMHWLAKNDVCTVYETRWKVFEGVDGSGLLVVPNRSVRFIAVVVPDAGQEPKQLCGFQGAPSSIALEMAAKGAVVVIPNVIRREREARNGRSKLTDQEFLYRSAFVLGRHVIGYQVQEVISAFEALKQTYGSFPTLVAGWGEGGSIALYAAAVDTRIRAACVSGHFGPRESIWSEPIHRNVHGLLEHFGDAQLAALIAPRSLVIDAVAGPEVEILGDGGAPGTLSGPSFEQAEREWGIVSKILEPWGIGQKIELIRPTDPPRQAHQITLKAIERSLLAIGVDEPDPHFQTNSPLVWGDHLVATADEHRRETVLKWDRFQQAVLERCATERDRFWSKLDTKTPESFNETIKSYREFFRKETIGDWEWDPMAPNPRTRLLHEEPKWLAYEVVLDVHEDVIAYGTLLIPRDGKPVMNRPCVVFQHGLEGRPSDTILGDHAAYHDVSRKLVEQGYVVFAPQNLYLFQDRFRTLQRKSNPLGKTLFSTIVAQHRQIVRWLGQREEIDPKRIAFYGLSYGGKSAMRIPALVPEYCLSICSADFNDWVWKNASTTSPYSYVWTNEYEIFEFGLGNHFNYAEMAALIAPRPFMVERGHMDGVAPDERVASEFAKVNRLYAAKLGLADRCQIEWFVGPHTIHGKGTFDFLRKHLR